MDMDTDMDTDMDIDMDMDGQLDIGCWIWMWGTERDGTGYVYPLIHLAAVAQPM